MAAGIDEDRLRAVLAVLLPAAAATAAQDGSRRPWSPRSTAPGHGHAALPLSPPLPPTTPPPPPPPAPVVLEYEADMSMRWLQPGSDPELAKWIPVAYKREMEELASAEAARWYREMHRRVCDLFRDVQQRRVDEIEAQIKAKEQEMRRKEDEKRQRLLLIEARIREVEAEARLRRAQMELLQLEIRHLEVRLRQQELQASVDAMSAAPALAPDESTPGSHGDPAVSSPPPSAVSSPPPSATNSSAGNDTAATPVPPESSPDRAAPAAGLDGVALGSGPVHTA